jgi:superkiller protein 3
MVVELKFEMEEAHYRLAINYAKKGMWQETVSYCNNVIKLNPLSARAYNQLGLALYCNGEVDEAIENYKKAIEIKPDYAVTYNNLGYALEKHGNFTEAVDSFNNFIKLTVDEESSNVIKEHIKELELSISIKEKD